MGIEKPPGSQQQTERTGEMVYTIELYCFTEYV